VEMLTDKCYNVLGGANNNAEKTPFLLQQRSYATAEENLAGILVMTFEMCS